MLPGEAVINGLVRESRRRELLEEFSAAGPQAVYAGLLAYAQAKGYQAGWAAHAFREIFSAWPRSQDRHVEPKPLPNDLIEEWAAGRKRKAGPRALPLFQR